MLKYRINKCVQENKYDRKLFVYNPFYCCSVADRVCFSAADRLLRTAQGGSLDCAAGWYCSVCAVCCDTLFRTGTECGRHPDCLWNFCGCLADLSCPEKDRRKTGGLSCSHTYSFYGNGAAGHAARNKMVCAPGKYLG